MPKRIDLSRPKQTDDDIPLGIKVAGVAAFIVMLGLVLTVAIWACVHLWIDILSNI